MILLATPARRAAAFSAAVLAFATLAVADGATLPPLDRERPAVTKTATLALG